MKQKSLPKFPEAFSRLFLCHLKCLIFISISTKFGTLRFLSLPKECLFFIMHRWPNMFWLPPAKCSLASSSFFFWKHQCLGTSRVADEIDQGLDIRHIKSCMDFSHFSFPEMSFIQSLHTFYSWSGLLNLQQHSWTYCFCSLSGSLTFTIHLEVIPVYEDLVRCIIHAVISYTVHLYKNYMHSTFI